MINIDFEQYPLSGWFPGHMMKAEKAMQEALKLVDLVLVIGADPAIDPDALRLVELINPGDLPIMAVHRNRLPKYDITRACLVTIAYSQFWWKASNHPIKKQ